MRNLIALAGLVAVGGSALKIPYISDFLNFGLSSGLSSQVVPHKIAIIGAGAAGSSAAFWIAKARERAGIVVDVDVYERADYVGGRSTTVYPYNDSSFPPIELGASIFVKTNRNLWRATDEFDLQRRYSDRDDEGSETGFWDGEQFVLRLDDSGVLADYWNKLKIVWRYGYTAPTRTQSLVDTMVKQILLLYSSDTPKWQNMTDFVETMGWSHLTSQSTSEFLDSAGIKPSFTREVVEAATRVNYGHNVDEIHALEGSVSMAAGGMVSVRGGNYKIFQHFLARSGAALHLNSTVTAIGKNPDGTWTVVTDRGTAKPYRDVIIAAPFHQTGIKVASETPISEVQPQPYVHLHVTLLSTTSTHPDPAYFGLPPNAKVPTTVLTTYEGARQGKKAPEFNSLTFNEQFMSHKGNESVVKIFSSERVGDERLKEVFGDTIGWVYRKEWDAYPVLPPTTSFPPMKLARGLYYVNAFEPVISTMETETLASRGVVDMLFSDRFGTGICGKPPSVEPQEGTDVQKVYTAPSDGTSRRQGEYGVDDDFVYGWDC